MHRSCGLPRRVSRRHDRSLPGTPPSRAVLTKFYGVSATLAPAYLIAFAAGNLAPAT